MRGKGTCTEERIPGREGGIRTRLGRVQDVLDSWMNRLYGWRYNPLYQSGTIAAVLLGIVLATGLYLLLFYRPGSPYESVARITEQWWGGRWIRSLHRYASDAALVAVAVHGVRMWIQGRTWGARATAWVTGLLLAFVVLVCGWTGFVMIWDEPGRVLAVEGVRLLDALPLFSEPLVRIFSGEGEIPGAFFFMNLFLHIALPIGLALLLWLHVSRLARPTLLPPRGLSVGLILILLAVSVLWPVGMEPPADPFRVPGEVTLDLFYTFWLPLTQTLPVWGAWAVALVGAGVLLLVPPWDRSRRSKEEGREASRVNERVCTGCEQCVLDCPYQAIDLVSIAEKDTPVARVDPELCVSCGICAGSCAPMGVGPPGRTGRDQLVGVREFIEAKADPDRAVIVACDRGTGGIGAVSRLGDSPVYRVSCTGSLHTSVLELLVRSGFAGVLVVTCPPRDCRNREGSAWLEARMYHDREAELQERVDRRRVRLLYAGPAEMGRVAEELERFRGELRALERSEAEEEVEPDAECEVPSRVGAGPGVDR